MGERIPAKNEDTLYVDLAGDHDKIYNRHVSKGKFLNLRRYTVWPLMLGFFILPWIDLLGRQSVWFDLPERKFYILWLTFYPQDGFMLAWLLIIAAFALFAVTNIYGRIWCGFTCPQTVWTQIFMWIEYRFEGDRSKRMKLDKQGWGIEKIRRRVGKYLAWLVVAFWTGLTFIGYFTPIRDLVPDMLSLSAGATTTFWVLLFTAGTYANAGFLREQVCKYMCPYARFQSVMYDSNTLIVTYDKVRGESRGPRKPKQDYKAEGLGDCIDCTWCVQVCPVDIDIRDGLQYECINCGLCADACDSIMDKMGYDKGLIKFSTEVNVSGGKTKILRPRFFGYALLITVMFGALVYALVTRVPMEADVARDRNVMYRTDNLGMIENPYQLKIVNMSEQTLTYEVSIVGQPDMILEGQTSIVVEAGEVKEGVIRVIMDPADIKSTRYDLELLVQAKEQPDVQQVLETRFMAPRANR